jgi:hypothetical protein
LFTLKVAVIFFCFSIYFRKCKKFFWHKSYFRYVFRGPKLRYKIRIMKFYVLLILGCNFFLSKKTRVLYIKGYVWFRYTTSIRSGRRHVWNLENKLHNSILGHILGIIFLFHFPGIFNFFIYCFCRRTSHNRFKNELFCILWWFLYHF